MQTVLGIILGGGAGSRLYPLTKKRAKPAVPLGANYRLIDIPVSNCINSGVNKIYCLTQFNSASLNRHLSQAFVSARPQLTCAAHGGAARGGGLPCGRAAPAAASPSNLPWFGLPWSRRSALVHPRLLAPPAAPLLEPCPTRALRPARPPAQNSNIGGYNSRGFVEVLAASQTTVDQEWFQGTADAVRKYMWLFEDAVRDGIEDFLILSGELSLSSSSSSSSSRIAPRGQDKELHVLWLERGLRAPGGRRHGCCLRREGSSRSAGNAAGLRHRRRRQLPARVPTALPPLLLHLYRRRPPVPHGLQRVRAGAPRRRRRHHRRRAAMRGARGRGLWAHEDR